MKDYGADPIGDGTFRMVPSGDIVDAEERTRRLAHIKTRTHSDCLGLTWEEIAHKQGGINTLDITRKR